MPVVTSALGSVRLIAPATMLWKRCISTVGMSKVVTSHVATCNHKKHGWRMNEQSKTINGTWRYSTVHRRLLHHFVQERLVENSQDDIS